MGRGRKHILDEMTSYFPNAKPLLWSTGDHRALHMVRDTPSPTLHREIIVRGSLT